MRFRTAILATILATACVGRPAVSTNAESDRVAADIARLKEATRSFNHLESAVAAGYPRAVADCLVHEHHGAMGYHHLNRNNLTRNIELDKPQILLYEMLPDSTYKLNGVEFILPYRLWPRDSVAPKLLGQTLHQEDNLKFWYLHVWAWRENSNGIFANFHADVKCPESTRKVYTPFPPL